MRSGIITCLLPLLATGAGLRLGKKFQLCFLYDWLIEYSEPRQGGLLGGLSSLLASGAKGLTDLAAPKQKAIKIEELTPKNAGAKRIRMTWGPLKLKGANVNAHIN
jgi:hypothetical protein